MNELVSRDLQSRFPASPKLREDWQQGRSKTIGGVEKEIKVEKGAAVVLVVDVRTATFSCYLPH